MNRFPKVQSPCPYQSNLSEYLVGDTCRMCQRQVHDLDEMTEAQRQGLLQACSGKLCVRYRLPLRTAVQAALVTSALSAAPAAAQDAVPSAQPSSVWLSAEGAAAIQECDSLEVIIVGGIKHAPEREYLEVDALEDIPPEIPTVYETGERGESQS